MIIKGINILNFKNIAEASLEFSDNVNCFVGMNGMGKSNFLDAIYYLSYGKSFSNMPDRMSVNHEAQFAMLQGEYERRGERLDIYCAIQRGKRKVLKRDGKEYQRLSEHVGLLPLVMVSPLDWELLRGGSEERRRFIDSIISQNNKEYLAALIRYNKALEQRNSMLRDGVSDALLFESVEMAMCVAASLIHDTRSKWIKEFTPIFHNLYTSIAGDGESVTLEYESALNGGTMAQILDANRGRDAVLGYTSQGVHRDDIELRLGDFSMRKIGSQGQCKTYTVALRLAQYDFLCAISQHKPLLLLDDIFDKLDAARVQRIVSIVSRDRFGQIFITDTNRQHIDEIITHMGGDHKIFEVANGVATPLIQ